MVGPNALMVKLVACLVQDFTDVVNYRMLCAVVTGSTAVLTVTHVMSLQAHVTSRLVLSDQTS